MPAPGPNPGRAPGAPERVGCGPRRSPGRAGVRRRTWRRNSRTRALENRLATLRHCSTRSPVGRRTRSRAGRSQIHRPRSSLRNDQATRRVQCRLQVDPDAPERQDATRWRGGAERLAARVAALAGVAGASASSLSRNFNFRGFGFRKRNFGFVQNRNLVFNHRFGRLRCLDRGWCLSLQRGRAAPAASAEL